MEIEGSFINCFGKEAVAKKKEFHDSLDKMRYQLFYRIRGATEIAIQQGFLFDIGSGKFARSIKFDSKTEGV
jgi:hypothetical protein